MKHSMHTKLLLAGAFVAAAGMAPLVASAHTNVWIGANLTGLIDDLVGAPPPTVVYAPPPAPVYYAPRPLPPPPPPVAYAPAPVYYATPPVYYSEAPAVGLNLYYQSNDWHHWHGGHGHWGHGRWHH